MKEYCKGCRIPLEEWEWCGRGYCEHCEEQMTHTERKNLTQPAEWWAAFESAAKAEGKSLSAWVGECCRSSVGTELSERPKLGRPAKAMDSEGLTE